MSRLHSDLTYNNTKDPISRCNRVFTPPTTIGIQCYVCNRGFTPLEGLRQHNKQPSCINWANFNSFKEVLVESTSPLKAGLGLASSSFCHHTLAEALIWSTTNKGSPRRLSEATEVFFVKPFFP